MSETDQETITTPPAPVVKPKEDNRDYEAELAAKDALLKDMESKMTAIEGSNQEAQAKRQELMVEVAQAINAREAIEKDRAAAIKKASEDLETVSQATQTLNQKSNSLQQEKDEALKRAEIAEARATKLEVITTEFPNLVRYAQWIPADKDPETVRKNCQLFQQAREGDLKDYGEVVSGGARQITSTGTPVVRSEPESADVMAERLDRLMQTDPKAFQAELNALKEQYMPR